MKQNLLEYWKFRQKIVIHFGILQRTIICTFIRTHACDGLRASCKQLWHVWHVWHCLFIRQIKHKQQRNQQQLSTKIEDQFSFWRLKHCVVIRLKEKRCRLNWQNMSAAKGSVFQWEINTKYRKFLRVFLINPINIWGNLIKIKIVFTKIFYYWFDTN